MHGKKKSPVEIHARFAAKRTREGKAAPTLGNVRRALKGLTYKQGLAETRGRKRKLSRTNALALNKARKELIAKANGQQEVHWQDVMRSARAPCVDPTTAARAVKELVPDLQWRPPREKPALDKSHKRERLEVCKEWLSWPKTHFTNKVHLVIDNKKFAVPTHKGAKARLKMAKVRGHLRTRREGLSEGFTKPSSHKHKSNPGAVVNICAGIANGKIALWHELPAKWNAEVAEGLYRGPIMKTLTAEHGKKHRYAILEDNDPAGFKANRAKAAKLELGIQPIRFPKYSPDLNPLDFYVWSEIERRMQASRITRVESPAECKARLRRVVRALPREALQKAVQAIYKRAQAVVDAKGGHVRVD